MKRNRPRERQRWLRCNSYGQGESSSNTERCCLHFSLC